MASLEASLITTQARAGNLVEPGDLVEIVFTAPPPQASDVKVQLIEAPGQGDQVRADRLVATFRGSISGGKFKLDVPGADPLDTNPTPNPEIANFAKSTNPPLFRIRFKDDPTESKVPLPDVEEENGAYELKLKVTGTVAGTAATFAGTAILNLRVRLDVMIVPDVGSATAAQKKSGEFALFSENATFADQWRKFAGARRQLVKIAIDSSLADFETAVNSAASKATGGDIILFVGHGGAGGFRGLSITVFDSTPSSTHGMSTHPNAINTDVLNLPNIAKQDASGKWIANDKISTDAQTKVDALALKFEMLKRIGGVLSQNKVARFIVAACNMAKDPPFGFKLAKLLQTTVGGYERLLATNGVTFTNPGKPTQNLVQCWLMSTDDPPADLNSDPNHPPSNDPNHSSFHEIPGGLRNFQASP